MIIVFIVLFRCLIMCLCCLVALHDIFSYSCGTI